MSTLRIPHPSLTKGYLTLFLARKKYIAKKDSLVASRDYSN
jgi:hypothetical protein